MNKIEPLDQNGLTDANASDQSPKLQNKIDSHGSILERLMDFTDYDFGIEVFCRDIGESPHEIVQNCGVVIFESLKGAC